MKRRIWIRSGSVEATAELNCTRTAQAIWEVLPLKARGNTWGDEVYFPIPVSLELENEQEVVSRGDLGYWAAGKAFCIFFGPTPISHGEEIRPASPVNVFGKILGDARIFKEIGPGVEIIVEREGHD